MGSDLCSILDRQLVRVMVQSLALSKNAVWMIISQKKSQDAKSEKLCLFPDGRGRKKRRMNERKK